jgi:hypothetical protein
VAAYIRVRHFVVDEAAGMASITVDLSEPSTREVSVAYTLGSGGATAGTDFGSVAGTLRFASGVVSQTVQVVLTNDVLAEATESFFIRLSGASNAVVASDVAWATVVDNDTVARDADGDGSLDGAERAHLSVRDVVVDEKAGIATFDLVLDKATTAAFSVNASTRGGSAEAGTDYTSVNDGVQFAAGQTVQHVSVRISDDGTAEANEYFRLYLGAVGGDGAAQVVVDEDAFAAVAVIGRSDQASQALPVVSCNSILVSEADGYAEFTLQLDAPGSGDVSVSYSLGNADAQAGSDYRGAAGTLHFAPGVTTQTVRVELVNDGTAEAAQSFALALSNVSNATLASNVAWATILDDDTRVLDADDSHSLEGGERAALTVRGVVANEQDGLLHFDLVLDKAATEAFSVDYHSEAGSATTGTDFTLATSSAGRVVFMPGQMVRHVTVNLHDDSTAEGDEIFNLVLDKLTGSGAGQVQIAGGMGSAVIARSDQPAQATPSLSCAAVVVSEADGWAEFTVRLDTPGQHAVAVSYALVNGGAELGSDFQGVSGTLRFAPGVTTQTVRVALMDGSDVQALQSLALRLANPVNALIANDVAWATIVDNDSVVRDANGSGSLESAERASLSVRDVVVDESAGLAVFDLVLDKAATAAFSVHWSTANGSATTVNGDYTAAAGSVGFAPGQTVQHVVVSLANDALAEGAEYFLLNLGPPSGSGAAQVQVVDASAVAVIGRNDQAAQALPTLSCAGIVAGEGDGYATFTVQLSAPALQAASVNYAFADAGAAGGSDYRGQPGTLRFAPGQTTQTVRVELVDGLDAERLQSFTLTLSAAVNARIANGVAWAAIVDNDTVVRDINASGAIDGAERANLSVRDVVVDESAGFATFDLVLDRAATDAFRVSYTTTAGSATFADFTAASGSLGFAAGQTVQHVVVSLSDDTVAEGQEFFNLNLGAISGGGNQVQVADDVGVALIVRNDQAAQALPVLSCASVMVSEADGWAELTLQLNAPATGIVSVDYSFAAANAEPGSDFRGTTGTLLFAAGTTAQTVRVELVEGGDGESLESFTLALSNSVNATLATSQAWISVVDNDAVVRDTNASGTLESVERAHLSVRDAVVDESAGLVTFDLVLDRATTDLFRVAYQTADGSAAAGADYVAANGSVGFAAGQTVQHVVVALHDDALAEGNEIFFLRLTGLAGTGASQVQIADGSAVGLIGLSDRATAATPVISCSPLLVSEGDGYAEFTVQLSAPSASTVAVSYGLSDGTAQAGSDAAGTSGRLAFAPGVTTQTVRVPLVDGTVAEGLESFALTLSNATHAVLARDRADVMIVDNDSVVRDANGSGTLETIERAHLSVRDLTVDEAAGLATFDLMLSKATTDAFQVAYTTVDGSAVAGADYVAASGNVGFAAGQTVQHVSVALRDDALAEGDERFSLLLTGLGGGAAAQVILEDDMGSALVGRSDQPAVAAPVLSCADVLACEGDGFVEFTVQLSAPGLGVVSVAYSLVAGSATQGTDYVGGNGTLRFAPGVTTQTVRVELRADAAAEGTETFALRLSSPTGATLGSATATATLADDDGNTTPLAYGAGDDTYLVTSPRQLVLERAGGGQDLVESSISYTLVDTDGAGNFGGNVENLRLLGSAAIDGTGNAQDNTLYAGSGNNVLDGGAGRDTVSYADARSAVTLSLALATVQATGGSGRDTLRNVENLTGSRFNDQLSGNDAGNLIDGGAGADTLAGGLGNDTLVGGAGQDMLTGGAGNEVFRFNALADSAAGAATRDTIADFSAGDLVDLRSLDANELLSGDQTFVWIGTAAFSANTPGQLRLAGNVLQASTDADTAAELEIVLTGRSSMAATDFLL